ncbi:MAG: DUF4129 domain-containing protein [Chloroflexi bacterium]|nr:DUF4129 domain-containing protein [Chloroflexota bacterium]
MRNPVLLSYLSLIVVESIWWFSGLAMFGAMTGLGGSPIPWFALLALFGLAFLAAWLFGGTRGDATTIALYQGTVALIAVYVTVASTNLGDSWSFKVAWPVDLFGGTYDAEGVADIVIALIASGFVWYRAQNLVAGGGIAGRLSRAFKLGTTFMAFALMVELGVKFDIGITQLLLPFFGASLVGLAAARLPQTDDAGNSSWPAVIGISVFSILGVGVVGGLLTGRYGENGVRGLIALWGVFVDAILWILRWPIELAMRAMWAIILWLQNVFVNEDQEVAPVDTVRPLSQDLETTVKRAENATEYALDALRWPLSILLIVVVFFILVFGYRRFSSRSDRSDDLGRESIRGDADAKADMMKLLSTLMPGWLKRGRRRSLWKWPEGETGVAEVFLLYFDTLAHAIRRGMVFDPNVTPNERTSALAVFLPGAPVDAITGRFNAACYGRQPSDLNELERLRRSVESAADQPRPTAGT